MTDAVPIVRRPAPSDQAPILVSSPHSGCVFPAEVLPNYALDVERLRRDGDLYVDELYEGVEAVGATFVTTPVSRFVVDLNRLRDDVSARAMRGATARRGPGYYGDRGVIWAVVSDGTPIYDAPLPTAEVERRRARYYDPYHAFVHEELRRLRERFGYAVLIDAHSMPSQALRRSGKTTQLRADVVPGDLLGASCASWLSDTSIEYWESAGYEVSPNDPYRGGAIARRHGRPATGVHAMQLELNRRLYMDERSGERLPTMDAIRAKCIGFVRAVIDAARAAHD